MPDWIVQLALTTVMGIIAYFLKSHKTQQEKLNNDQQEQIKRIDRELQSFKLEAADRYVHKDDFIRATAQTDRKLDRIYDEIIKLTSNKNTEGKT